MNPMEITEAADLLVRLERCNRDLAATLVNKVQIGLVFPGVSGSSAHSLSDALSAQVLELWKRQRRNDRAAILRRLAQLSVRLTPEQRGDDGDA